MILRVVSGRVPAGQLPAVRAAFTRDYLPATRRFRGLDRYLVATRPAGDGHEIAMMTVWHELDDALAAFDGDLEQVRTIDGLDHGEILDRVDHYEVDLSEVKQSSGTPRFLRLTAGVVGHGLDSDIQGALRTRLADLPEVVVDAYVGRRVMGATVEIAFVSTWTEQPAGFSLDAPIWPDISAHYETFTLGLYDVLLEGAGPA
ncbi:MAG TPA: hypothetical protein VGO64_11945 [Candidatus Limnocylindrales bacterium]|nr:hypothetical protein [Candidatus Limnocylindrales bacterium]